MPSTSGSFGPAASFGARAPGGYGASASFNGASAPAPGGFGTGTGYGSSVSAGAGAYNGVATQGGYGNANQAYFSPGMSEAGLNGEYQAQDCEDYGGFSLDWQDQRQAEWQERIQ